MRRLFFAAVPLSASLVVTACMTYTQDLERAHRHYDSNQFDQALALCRVLEGDMDSFSVREQAEYAYVRGMTDYRLSSLAPQSGGGMTDARRGYRDHSRHWLGLAAAIERQTPDVLTPEQRQRLGETLEDLNRDVYGTAETETETDTPDAGTPPPSP